MSGRTTGDSRPRVLTFPQLDVAFRAHIDRALERYAPYDPAKLQSYLRNAYPDARVVERDALAGLGGEQVWYVYRDGSGWSADKDWWIHPDLAEFAIDGTGTYVAANAQAAELVGLETDAIVGKRVGAFTVNETGDQPRRLEIELARQTGCLESTAIIVRSDGEKVAVRYRVTGTQDDGYRMVMQRR